MKGPACALALGLALAGAGPARAANVVNIEVDWMTAPAHDHKPQQSEIDAVVQMFACHGITLNVVLDQAIPEQSPLKSSTSAKFFSDATDSNTFQHLRVKYFGHAGQAGWHYCIFGHNYQINGGDTGSSGISELPGYGLLVAMGSFNAQVGTPWDRASTFAHELGHNFGLTHAGSMDETVVGKFVPIYPSLMSYMFQLRGVKTHLACLGMIGADHRFKDLDYSNGRMPNVDENALSEPAGMGISPVDWNCNGTISGTVAHDLDSPSNDWKWCDATGALQVLNDTDDWSIVLNAIAHPPVPQAVPTVSEPCMSAPTTPVGFRATGASDCDNVQPAVAVEPAVVGDMYFADASAVGPVTGTGRQPFHDAASAVAGAAPGSVVYFRPNTYHAGTGVLSKAVLLTGPQPFLVVQ